MNTHKRKLRAAAVAVSVVALGVGEGFGSATLAFDLDTLPPIASIDAGTDIRPYLAPDIPEALTREALRRAWSSDPAIRDFVGLAENQEGFPLLADVAGAGPVKPDDTEMLIARPVGGAGDELSEAPMQFPTVMIGR